MTDERTVKQMLVEANARTIALEKLVFALISVLNQDSILSDDLKHALADEVGILKPEEVMLFSDLEIAMISVYANKVEPEVKSTPKTHEEPHLHQTRERRETIPFDEKSERELFWARTIAAEIERKFGRRVDN